MILLGGKPDAGTRHAPVAPHGEIQSAACSKQAFPRRLTARLDSVCRDGLALASDHWFEPSVIHGDRSALRMGWIAECDDAQLSGRFWAQVEPVVDGHASASVIADAARRAIFGAEAFALFVPSRDSSRE
jgi:hypothetical protein